MAEPVHIPEMDVDGFTMPEFPESLIRAQGFGALEEALAHGIVKIIALNGTPYYVMNQTAYAAVRGDQGDAEAARIADSLADVHAGDVERVDVAGLLARLGSGQ